MQKNTIGQGISHPISNRCDGF